MGSQLNNQGRLHVFFPPLYHIIQKHTHRYLTYLFTCPFSLLLLLMYFFTIASNDIWHNRVHNLIFSRLLLNI